MKKIKTLRFGEIEEDENKIVRFAQGMPAFEGEHEFILILPDTSREQLEHTAQNLLKRISFNPFLNELHVTLSIGGYAWNSSQSTNNATQLIEAADTALYTAKENGRNQYQILS